MSSDRNSQGSPQVIQLQNSVPMRACCRAWGRHFLLKHTRVRLLSTRLMSHLGCQKKRRIPDENHRFASNLRIAYPKRDCPVPVCCLRRVKRKGVKNRRCQEEVSRERGSVCSRVRAVANILSANDLWFVHRRFKNDACTSVWTHENNTRGQQARVRHPPARAPPPPCSYASLSLPSTSVISSPVFSSFFLPPSLLWCFLWSDHPCKTHTYVEGQLSLSFFFSSIYSSVASSTVMLFAPPKFLSPVSTSLSPYLSV